MINVLINTKNTYTNHAIRQLLQETIASGESLTFEDDYTQDSIVQAHIIFTEMEPGEIFLCHDELKYTNGKTLLCILQERKIEYIRKELPNCIKESLFLYKSDSIPTIRNKIKSGIDRVVTSKNEEHPSNEAMRCINCPCKSITQAQSKVVHALSLGLNQLEIAQELKINYKTVFSHKKNVMHDFKIQSNKELNRFLSVLMKRKKFMS